MGAINPAYTRQPGGGNSGGAILPSGGVLGDVPIKTGPGDEDWTYIPLNTANAVLGCTIDGAGSVIAVGATVDVPVPYNCTIQENEILVDPLGSMVVDVWKDSYANYPPTVADSIVAAAPITVAGAVKNKDSTLTGWSVNLLAGDVLRFRVNSVTAVIKATVFVRVLK